MLGIGLGLLLLILLGVYYFLKNRQEGFTAAPWSMDGDNMFMSKRPDVCSMYTNATDCKGSGGCSWNTATGMCQVGPTTEGYTSATCSQWTGCSDCNKNESCGWCAGTNKCLDRTELPTLCTGTNKAITSRADCCTQHTGCTNCANEDDCGWCKTNGKCTLGDNFGTSAGTCNPEDNYTTFAGTCGLPAAPVFNDLLGGNGSTTTTGGTTTTTGGTTTTTGGGACPPRDITVAEYNTLKNRLITDLVAEIRKMRA